MQEVLRTGVTDGREDSSAHLVHTPIGIELRIAHPAPSFGPHLHLPSSRLQHCLDIPTPPRSYLGTDRLVTLRYETCSRQLFGRGGEVMGEESACGLDRWVAGVEDEV